MSVQIMFDRYEEKAALYCSSTDWCFGPVIHEAEGRTAVERAEAFLRWLGVDARTLDDSTLATRWSDWQAQEFVQVDRERLDALERDEVEGVLLDHEVPELAALRARTDLR
jgi:hypothetical protein